MSSFTQIREEKTVRKIRRVTKTITTREVQEVYEEEVEEPELAIGAYIVPKEGAAAVKRRKLLHSQSNTTTSHPLPTVKVIVGSAPLPTDVRGVIDLSNPLYTVHKTLSVASWAAIKTSVMDPLVVLAKDNFVVCREVVIAYNWDSYLGLIQWNSNGTSKPGVLKSSQKNRGLDLSDPTQFKQETRKGTTFLTKHVEKLTLQELVDRPRIFLVMVPSNRDPAKGTAAKADLSDYEGSRWLATQSTSQIAAHARKATEVYRERHGGQEAVIPLVLVLDAIEDANGKNQRRVTFFNPLAPFRADQRGPVYLKSDSPYAGLPDKIVAGLINTKRWGSADKLVVEVRGGSGQRANEALLMCVAFMEGLVTGIGSVMKEDGGIEAKKSGRPSKKRK